MTDLWKKIAILAVIPFAVTYLARALFIPVGLIYTATVCSGGNDLCGFGVFLILPILSIAILLIIGIILIKKMEPILPNKQGNLLIVGFLVYSILIVGSSQLYRLAKINNSVSKADKIVHYQNKLTSNTVTYLERTPNFELLSDEKMAHENHSFTFAYPKKMVLKSNIENEKFVFWKDPPGLTVGGPYAGYPSFIELNTWSETKNTDDINSVIDSLIADVAATNKEGDLNPKVVLEQVETSKTVSGEKVYFIQHADSNAIKYAGYNKGKILIVKDNGNYVIWSGFTTFKDGMEIVKQIVESASFSDFN